MRSKLYKWLVVCSIWILSSSLVNHPIYVSVIEIEHNAKDKTLEVSCKIFTDDFEKALRAAYKTHVDLLKESEKEAMNKLVSEYVEKHLKITVNDQVKTLQFQGFEPVEEGIYSFYLVEDVPAVKHIVVTDNILYEYQSQQISLVHVTVDGKRQSNKLVNPEDKVSLSY